MANICLTRRATPDDVDSIMEVFVEVAPAVPVGVSTPAEHDACRREVEECCTQPTSWVAVDSVGKVIGYLIGKHARINSRTRRTMAGIELRYGGVAKQHQGEGIFSELLYCAMCLGIPIYAIVKVGNKAGSADILARKGFVVWDPIFKMADDTAWGWLPKE